MVVACREDEAESNLAWRDELQEAKERERLTRTMGGREMGRGKGGGEGGAGSSMGARFESWLARFRLRDGRREEKREE